MVSSLNHARTFKMADKEVLLLLRLAKDRSYPSFVYENEGNWSDNFFFIQAADTQFGLIDNWAQNPKESRVWDEEIRLTKLAIQKANAMSPRPKFFIVCGDLVDAMPFEMHREAQEADFKKIFQELDPEIPLVCVCGNHDIGNSPTEKTITNYRKKFGDDYFSFWVGGIFFIVLNSQYYHDHTHVPNEFDEQEKWLDDQLEIPKSGQCKHCLIFQHIPWFLKDSNEEDEYFNLPTDVRKRMLKKFYDAGVRHVFCGHYHQNAGGFYNNLEVVVTSAIGQQLGNEKSGMRIVRISEKKVDHKYYSLEELPVKIDLNEEILLP